MATIDALRVEIDGRAIVDGVSVAVLPGRCTALVGASGSGKTTTGLALLGEHPPTARVTGTVRVTGGRAGYVPQQPAAALNPVRRAGALLGDIARLGGGSRAERAARTAEALRLAQLPEPNLVLRRYPHQLSGGQQQRTVLAQALLLGARVIVADEPTTGQDALTKQRVADELRQVLRRGIGVLLLSHDLDLVRELADEVVVLRGGRTVETGPAAQVLGAPQHPWTRELLDAARGGRRAAARSYGAVPARTGSTADGRARPDTGRARAPGGLTAERVTAWHGRRRAGGVVLHEASATVAAGECLAVVGRSGSGKTTLARCLAGLHRGRSGRVLLDGEPLPRSVRGRDRRQLAAVQYVFQDARASFDEYRPVAEQVARTAVRLRGTDPDTARSEALGTLAGMGIGEETAGRRPGGLSGGELQRAALARALLARPRVLICDEITSGLDAVSRRDICELLRRLTVTPSGGGTAGSRAAASGTAGGGTAGGTPVDATAGRAATGLVLITHDLAVAAELADRIAVLDAGRIVEQGPAAELLSAPGHPFTRQLLAATGGVTVAV